jgi:hypothetical protein
MRAALLYTEEEIVKHFNLTVEQFRKNKLQPAGSYTPPRSRTIHLYSKSDVDRLGRKLGCG